MRNLSLSLRLWPLKWRVVIWRDSLDCNLHGPKLTTLRSCRRSYPLDRGPSSPFGRVFYRYRADGSNTSIWIRLTRP